MNDSRRRLDQPSVIYDLDEEIYHADGLCPEPSLSSTMAKTILQPAGPARLREVMRNGSPRKPEFDFGSAAHSRILGRGQEIVALDGDARTKAYKEAKAAAEEEGKLALKSADVEAIDRMAEAILDHELAAELLTAGQGLPEVSMFGIDEQTGRWGRGRIDFLHSRSVIVDYKGLAVDTPIPTPSGWTTMGDIRVGDEVFDANGRVCRVAAKSSVHHRPCFEFTFDDGSTVICDDEHRWVTTTSRDKVTAVRTAREIRDTLRRYGQRQHRIAVAGQLDLPEADLPIDPYVLGCWLGDGSARDGRITNPDDELFGLIAQRGFETGPDGSSKDRCQIRTVYGLRTLLRRAGLLNNKHIPGGYLRAGVEQRLALLRGLMDTDGSWNACRQQAVFVTVNIGLAEQVRELALSLGERAILQPFRATGFGKTLTAYRVTYRPIRHMPFLLSAKRNKVEVRTTIESSTRLVNSVQEVESVPTQCIEVDSPDRTYLCGRAMIPTHNTTRSVDDHQFSRSAWDFGYWTQAAHYIRLGQQLDLLDDDPTWLLVAQEKTAPYLVRVFEFRDEELDFGHAQIRRAFDLWDRCLTTGEWPAYPPTPTILTAPSWALDTVLTTQASAVADDIEAYLKEKNA